MKIIRILLLVITLLMLIVSCDQKPYKISQGYMYIQKEERRNEATQWQLVWEDDLNKGVLDTNTWRRIGLFESPKWKVPVEEWKAVKNCFRYITARSKSKIVDPCLLLFTFLSSFHVFSF